MTLMHPSFNAPKIKILLLHLSEVSGIEGLRILIEVKGHLCNQWTKTTTMVAKSGQYLLKEYQSSSDEHPAPHVVTGAQQAQARVFLPLKTEELYKY